MVEEDRRSHGGRSCSGVSQGSERLKKDFANALSLLGGHSRPGKLSPDEAMNEHPHLLHKNYSEKELLTTNGDSQGRRTPISL